MRDLKKGHISDEHNLEEVQIEQLLSSLDLFEELVIGAETLQDDKKRSQLPRAFPLRKQLLSALEHLIAGDLRISLAGSVSKWLA